MPEPAIPQAPIQTRQTHAQTAMNMLRSLIMGIVWFSIPFLSAGTLHWVRGWIFASIYVPVMAALGMAVHHWNPGLMTARLKWRNKDTKRFDKVFTAIHLPLAFLLPGIAGLDAVRFRWSAMPGWTLPLGIILFLLGTALMGWALAVNPWAESTVRIQLDRGHSVVRNGPYRFVRHPMYVGALAMYPAMACMLGSRWALALAGVTMVLFIWRTANEDSVLRRELPGYEAYAAVTRYRLLPGIW